MKSQSRRRKTRIHISIKEADSRATLLLLLVVVVVTVSFFPYSLTWILDPSSSWTYYTFAISSNPLNRLFLPPFEIRSYCPSLASPQTSRHPSVYQSHKSHRNSPAVVDQVDRHHQRNIDDYEHNCTIHSNPAVSVVKAEWRDDA